MLTVRVTDVLQVISDVAKVSKVAGHSPAFREVKEELPFTILDLHV